MTSKLNASLCCLFHAVDGGSGFQVDTGGSGPVFVSYDVYKGKGAMSVKPIPPKWEQLEKGGFKLQRCEGRLNQVLYPWISVDSNRLAARASKVDVGFDFRQRYAVQQLSICRSCAQCVV